MSGIEVCICIGVGILFVINQCSAASWANEAKGEATTTRSKAYEYATAEDKIVSRNIIAMLRDELAVVRQEASERVASAATGLARSFTDQLDRASQKLTQQDFVDYGLLDKRLAAVEQVLATCDSCNDKQDAKECEVNNLPNTGKVKKKPGRPRKAA